MPHAADAPHAPGHVPIAGHIPQWQKDPVKLITSAATQGDVVRLGLPGRTYLVTHPAGVKHVLQDNNQNYTKGWVFDRIRPYWGESLLTAEGDTWKQQRRRVQPSFKREHTSSFAPIVTRRTEEMLARWDRTAAASGDPVAIYHEMTQLALVIIGDVLFGIDLWTDAPEMAGAAQTALAVLKKRVAALAPLPLWVPTPDNRRFNEAMRLLNEHIDVMIARAQQDGASRRSFLTMLMDARDENGEKMSDRQLHEEILGMLQQGHDTVGETLAWTWYLLSRNPDAERTMREEVAQVLGDRMPVLADLPNLPYTHLVLQESMRLYPPVWVIPRDATNDDVIGGYRVPAGSTILLSPYVTHRRPEFWDNPEAFDPLRFLPERSKTRPRHAYFPFGGGPRLCMGADMATMEMALIMAMVMQRYRVQVAPGHREEPECILDMVPRHRVPATLERAPRIAPVAMPEPAYAFAGGHASASPGVARCPFH